MENEEEGQSIESFVGGGAVENEEEGQAHQGLGIDQALQVVGQHPTVCKVDIQQLDQVRSRVT